jgi:hypothetical protein
VNDGRVAWFFQHIPQPRTILELGSLEGGHTLALSRHPGVERVLGLEGRSENFRRAQFVKQAYDARTINCICGRIMRPRTRPRSPKMVFVACCTKSLA